MLKLTQPQHMLLKWISLHPTYVHELPISFPGQEIQASTADALLRRNLIVHDISLHNSILLRPTPAGLLALVAIDA